MDASETVSDWNVPAHIVGLVLCSEDIQAWAFAGYPSESFAAPSTAS